MEQQGLWLEEFLACRKHYDDEQQPVWKHTLLALESAFQAGALGSKEKHLMAVCLGVKDHCPPCTIGHLQAALAAGASKDEILEAVGVTISMCGTTAMGGAWRVFKLLEEKGLFPAAGDAD